MGLNLPLCGMNRNVSSETLSTQSTRATHEESWDETTTIEDWAREDSSTDAQFRTLREGPDCSMLKLLPLTISGKGE